MKVPLYSVKDVMQFLGAVPGPFRVRTLACYMQLHKDGIGELSTQAQKYVSMAMCEVKIGEDPMT